MDYYKRIYKGVKDCPCCGGKAYFGIVSGGTYDIQCEECGLSGKNVNLPTYYSKGGVRLMGRLFIRALKPWNKRCLVSKIDILEVSKILERMESKKSRLP